MSEKELYIKKKLDLKNQNKRNFINKCKLVKLKEQMKKLDNKIFNEISKEGHVSKQNYSKKLNLLNRINRANVRLKNTRLKITKLELEVSELKKKRPIKKKKS